VDEDDDTLYVRIMSEKVYPACLELNNCLTFKMFCPKWVIVLILSN